MIIYLSQLFIKQFFFFVLNFYFSVFFSFALQIPQKKFCSEQTLNSPLILISKNQKLIYFNYENVLIIFLKNQNLIFQWTANPSKKNSFKGNPFHHHKKISKLNQISADQQEFGNRKNRKNI